MFGTVVDAIVAGLTGGVGYAAVRYAVPSAIRALKHWHGNRAQIKRTELETQAAEAKAKLAHDATVAPALLRRIETLEQQRETDREERRQERQSDREECARQRREDADRCKEEIREEVARARAELARDVVSLGRRLRAVLVEREDDTGVHEIDGVLRRAGPRSTPPEFPAYRAPTELGPVISKPPPLLRRSSRTDLDPET